MRITQMNETSLDIMQELEQKLTEKLSLITKNDYIPSGGINSIVKVLKSSDRGTEQIIISSLGENEPDLADEIKRRMFVFEDIVLLDDKSIERIIQEIEIKDFARAIKGFDKELQTIIINKISKETLSKIKKEIKDLKQIRKSEVVKSQEKIVDSILYLEMIHEIVVTRLNETEY